ncbi:CsxC family protein [Aneurinibacillus sp. REN35]|uniref:CsxC family protein n=1 Tax=Aneurinibacillus sp. REN35 TaxID=3237286 RepID=UPI0035275D6E
MSICFDDSANINESDGTIVTPQNLTPSGHRIVKVPVLLQELSVQIPLKARIKFPDPVLEIKKIKKRVKVTQCRLVQPRTSRGPRGKLFLSGFVRKNIQYATPYGSDRDEVFSRLRSLTVDVPFDTVIEIEEFLTPPVGPFFNVRREFDFLVHKPLPSGFPEKDELMANDLSQYHQQSTEFFNEIVFCELVRSDITEWDEATNRKPLHNGPFEEGVFTELIEKMVLDLTLKVLQNQQVRVNAR